MTNTEDMQLEKERKEGIKFYNFISKRGLKFSQFKTRCNGRCKYWRSSKESENYFCLLHGNLHTCGETTCEFLEPDKEGTPTCLKTNKKYQVAFVQSWTDEQESGFGKKRKNPEGGGEDESDISSIVSEIEEEMKREEEEGEEGENRETEIIKRKLVFRSKLNEFMPNHTQTEENWYVTTCDALWRYLKDLKESNSLRPINLSQFCNFVYVYVSRNGLEYPGSLKIEKCDSISKVSSDGYLRMNNKAFGSFKSHTYRKSSGAIKQLLNGSTKAEPIVATLAKKGDEFAQSVLKISCLFTKKKVIIN